MPDGIDRREDKPVGVGYLPTRVSLKKTLIYPWLFVEI